MKLIARYVKLACVQEVEESSVLGVPAVLKRRFDEESDRLLGGVGVGAALRQPLQEPAALDRVTWERHPR